MAANVHARVTLPTGGVYVVAVDPDIAGTDNLVCAFVNESDADAVVRAIEAIEGEGRAWQTYEPVVSSLDDEDLLGLLEGRGITRESLRQAAAC